MVSRALLLVHKAGYLSRTPICLPVASMATSLMNNEVSVSFNNRNPRNLERLRIARKPSGYHLEVPGREFWHKLILEQNARHVTAKIVHHSGVEVITASTKEWAIRKYLYSTSDISAYMNIARVFADRCLESGITEVFCDMKPHPGGKVEAFLSGVTEGGVTLSEPDRFLPHRPWDVDRPEKPWDITE